MRPCLHRAGARAGSARAPSCTSLAMSKRRKMRTGRSSRRASSEMESRRACGAKASEMEGRDEPAAQKRPGCRVETSLRRQKRPGLHDRDSHDRDGAGARAGSARSEVCGGPGDVRQRPRVQLLELLRASLNAEFWLTDEEVNSAAVRQRLLLTPVRHLSFATLEPGLGDGADPPKAATSAHATPSRTADGASGRIVSRVGQRPPRRPPRRRSRRRAAACA